MIKKTKSYSIILLSIAALGTQETRAEDIILSCPKASAYRYSQGNNTWSAPSHNPNKDLVSDFSFTAPESLKLRKSPEPTADIQPIDEANLMACTYKGTPSKKSQLLKNYKASAWLSVKLKNCKVNEDSTSLTCTLEE